MIAARSMYFLSKHSTMASPPERVSFVLQIMALKMKALSSAYAKCHLMSEMAER